MDQGFLNISLQLGATVQYIRAKTSICPQIALVLGSGLGAFIDQYKEVSIAYQEIPHFPQSHVEGHQGNLVFGRVGNKDVIAMQGRFHYYEGHAPAQVVYPLQVMKALGAVNLVVTNAAGCLNPDFQTGDLMLISDHINMMGFNPLRGIQPEEGISPFTDMTRAYDPDFILLAEEVGKQINLQLRKGIYAGMGGPCYETPAEVKMLQSLGCDAVGMSTVPEVIMANYLKMKVVGISCLTNMAAGITGKVLSHQEVIDTSNKVKYNFSKLLYELIMTIP